MGDVVLTPEQRAEMFGGGTFRNADGNARLWTNGIVPYTFKSGFPESYKRVWGYFISVMFGMDRLDAIRWWRRRRETMLS